MHLAVRGSIPSVFFLFEVDSITRRFLTSDRRLVLFTVLLIFIIVREGSLVLDPLKYLQVYIYIVLVPHFFINLTLTFLWARKSFFLLQSSQLKPMLRINTMITEPPSFLVYLQIMGQIVTRLCKRVSQ